MYDTYVRKDFEGTVWVELGADDKTLFRQVASRLTEIANDVCRENPTSNQAWDEACRFSKLSQQIRRICSL